MVIRTAYGTNSQGRGHVLAKGGGKQRTTPWDQSKSTDWNHGNAAGVLILALGQSDSWVVGDALESIAEGNAIHDANDSGTKHGFRF